MNDKQLQAVELARNGHSLFITGGIGTGKTQVVTSIVEVLESRGSSVAVTASTGLASKQIIGIPTLPPKNLKL